MEISKGRSFTQYVLTWNLKLDLYMKSKPFLLAVAAFALTASGVQAFGNAHMLQRAGLSQAQISAFEIAREKREAGDFDGARDVLVEAGVDEDLLKSVHKIAHQNQIRINHSLAPVDHYDHILGLGHFSHDLSNEQWEVIQVAQQANDKETVRAVFKEAGIDRPSKDHR